MNHQEVVLITGTSTGIGRLMAETCARKGYSVFASMRNTTGRNAAHRADLRALAEAEGLSLDVVQPTDGSIPPWMPSPVNWLTVPS